MKGNHIVGLFAMLVHVLSMFSLISAFAPGNGHGADAFAAIAASTDVAWLERIAASLDAAESLTATRNPTETAGSIRAAAYVRLGQLATPEAVAAIERIEGVADRGSLVPERLDPRIERSPLWQSVDRKVDLQNTARASNGMTYAIVRSEMLGDPDDFFFISSRTPEDMSSWSRPRLIRTARDLPIRKPTFDLHDANDLALLCEERSTQPFSAAWEPTQASWMSVRIPLADLLRDSDQDGWTDIEEIRLGLNPVDRDTDRDGIPDGTDTCPNFAQSGEDKGKEEVQILERAVFAAFALSGSRALLWVDCRSDRLLEREVRKIHVRGYQGPVLYIVDSDSWLQKHIGSGTNVEWFIATRDANHAAVTITTSERASTGSQSIRVAKIGQKWYAVGRVFVARD